MVNKLFIVLLLFTLLINNVKCVDVNSAQFTCITEIVKKTGDVLLSSTDFATKLCSSPPNRCSSDGYITALQINQVIRTSLLWSDLSCFPQLNTFYGWNLLIGSAFLNPVGPKISSLFIYTSDVRQITVDLPKLDRFVIGGLDMSAPVLASHFKKVIEFSTDSTGGFFSFVVDSDQTGSSLSTLNINSDNVPNLSTFTNISNLGLLVGTGFQISTMATSSIGFERLETIKIATNGILYTVDFPVALSSFANPRWNILSIQGFQFNSVKQLIDLSNNKLDTINEITLLPAGPNFNFNGQFPFSAFPTGKINKININNGSMSNLPSMDLFKNVTTLALTNLGMSGVLPKNVFSNKARAVSFSGNKLTGTVDSSWCSVSPSLYVSDNLLTGDLPDCIQCFLSDTDVYSRYKNNNFNNFSNNVTCGYDKISVHSLNVTGRSITLVGKNIGFNPMNIKSTPEIWFSQYTDINTIIGTFSDYKFNNSNEDIKTVEIQFVKPGINFTVSIIDTAPNVTNINQVNNTFIIDGTFFSYDTSILNVMVGNNKCNIINATFYQIQCQLDYPIKDEGIKPLNLVVGNYASNHIVDLKYTPYECSVPDCNGKGVCNDHIGVCLCNIKWASFGNLICSVSNHYISSTNQILSSTDVIGTLNLTIYGWFGEYHNDMELYIGDQSSIIYSITNDTIIASINPIGSGSKKLTFIQNAITWVGLVYPYSDPIILCKSNCSGNGECNTVIGECKCNYNYTGLDCNSSTNINSNITSTTNITPLSGSTIITNEGVSYQILIDSIVEIDLNDQPIPNSLIDLRVNKWIEINDSSNSEITILNQQFNNTIITMIIEGVNLSNKQFSFAGNEFTILKGGFKISLSISNWEYKSNLNVLQVQMSSDISIDESLNNGGSCNDDGDNIDTLIESTSSSNTFKDNLNYLTIIKNGKILYGRFQNRMLSDSRPTTILSKLISSDNKSVKIIMQLPHCTVCSIDPDFSLLLTSPSSKDSNCGETSNRKWVIPVAVIVSVVGVSCLFIAGFIIYRKNIINIKVGVAKLKELKK